MALKIKITALCLIMASAVFGRSPGWNVDTTYLDNLSRVYATEGSFGYFLVIPHKYGIQVVEAYLFKYIDYKEYYRQQYSTYKEFLIALYNDPNMLQHEKEVSMAEYVKSKPYKDYKKMGFEEFRDKYTYEKDDDGLLYMKIKLMEKLKPGDKRFVAKIFFDNHYYILLASDVYWGYCFSSVYLKYGIHGAPLPPIPEYKLREIPKELDF